LQALAQLLHFSSAVTEPGNRLPLHSDNVFAVHERALAIGSQRLQLLAANVANADTPHYKARDIDFKAAMQSAEQDSVPLTNTHSRHISAGAGPNRATPMYRVPDQPSLDGNTVDGQRESAVIGETAVRYQATLTFLNQKIRGLRLAITGGR
jgi:flagellar basal-body rod protein FlgB